MSVIFKVLGDFFPVFADFCLKKLQFLRTSNISVSMKLFGSYLTFQFGEGRVGEGGPQFLLVTSRVRAVHIVVIFVFVSQCSFIANLAFAIAFIPCIPQFCYMVLFFFLIVYFFILSSALSKF